MIEEVSEEEEDDVVRKKELQQLICEQLQDDMLDDDSVSSGDCEISRTSTPLRSPVKMDDLNLKLDSSHEASFNDGMRSGNQVPIQPGYHVSVAEYQGQTIGQMLSPSVAMPTMHEKIASGNVYANRDNNYGDHDHRKCNYGDGYVDYCDDRSNYDESMRDRAFYDHHVEGVDSRRTMTSEDDVDPHFNHLLQRAQTHSSYQSHTLSPPDPHPSQFEGPGGSYSLEQLQVLYEAKGRQVSDMMWQLASQKEDTERHVAILREKQEVLEERTKELELVVEEAQQVRGELEAEVVPLRAELEAETTRSAALEAGKDKIMSHLVSAEATISALKQQVGELNSSECLARLRESYTTALAQAEQLHRQQLAQVVVETHTAKEELEAKEEVICSLNQELNDIRHHSQDHTHPDDHAHPNGGHLPHGNKVVQQLKFGNEGNDGGGDGERERLVQLATQVEDLNYQLGTLAEELEVMQKRAEIAEGSLSVLTPQLSGVQGENGILNAQVLGLQRRLEVMQVNVDSEKRGALDQCRLACLELQEDSMRHMRESFAAEMEKATQDLARQITQGRDDLATFKERYVVVCGEKEMILREMEATKKTQEFTSEKLQKAEAHLAEMECDRTLKEKELLEEVQKLKNEHAHDIAVREEAEVRTMAEEMKKVREEEEEARTEEIERVRMKETELKRAEVETVKEEMEHAMREEVENMREAMDKKCKEEVRAVKEEIESAKKEEVERMKHEVEYVRAEGEKEVRRCVEKTVREARMAWLKERDKSVQRQIETAVGAARESWKRSQRCPTFVDTGNGIYPERLVSNEVLRKVRAVWEEEKRMEFQKLLKAVKQELESNYLSQLQSGLSAEERKWEAARLGWEDEKEEGLVAMRDQWKMEKEQEFEKARESLQQDMLVKIEEVMMKAKKSYGAALESMKESLCARHAHEKELLTQQLRHLETRLAQSLQELQLERGRDRGGCYHEVRQLLEQWAMPMKHSMLALVQEIEEKTKSHYESCFQEVMQETSEKVKSYYLKCLYQLVSDITLPGDQSDTIDAISHDPDLQSFDPDAKYYPLLSEKSDRSSATEKRTTESTYNQVSPRKTSRKDSAIVEVVSRSYSEPDMSRKPGMSRKPDVSRKPDMSRKPFSQSSLASQRLLASRNVDIPSSSSSHKTSTKGVGGAEKIPRKKVDDKVAQHKASSSRAVRVSSTSKFVPSTKLILHPTSPETSPTTISWRVPVSSAGPPSPPKGVHWKNCSMDKKLL